MSMAKRTDCHRPRAIDTNDYQYVAIEYLKMDGAGDAAILIQERAVFNAHKERTGATWSTHQHGGNCHVCGAHCIYTFIFWHKPTNTYIRVGSTCVDKMDVESGDAFRTLKLVKAGVADARMLIAGKTKAQATLLENDVHGAWEIYSADADRLKEMGLITATTRELHCHDCNGTGVVYMQIYSDEAKTVRVLGKYAEQSCPSCKGNGHRTVDYTKREKCFEILTDIIDKLVKYGSISDKQMNFVAKLADQCQNFKSYKEERDAKRAAEREAAEDVPVTDDRIKFTGTIVSVKFNDNWAKYNITVKDDRGFLVWGSLPKAIDPDEAKGLQVEFMATVTQSDRDTKFGFFKRPTKVKVLQEVE